MPQCRAAFSTMDIDQDDVEAVEQVLDRVGDLKKEAQEGSAALSEDNLIVLEQQLKVLRTAFRMATTGDSNGD